MSGECAAVYAPMEAAITDGVAPAVAEPPSDTVLSVFMMMMLKDDVGDDDDDDDGDDDGRV